MGKTTSDIFGEIEFEDKNIITFVEPILGFPHSTRYIVIPHENVEVFYWLHSLDEGNLCFLVTSPKLFFPDYEPSISSADRDSLDLKPGEGEVLSLITIPEKIEDMTANLAGPILLNQEKVLAKQVITRDDQYTTKHKLIVALPEGAAVGE